MLPGGVEAVTGTQLTDARQHGSGSFAAPPGQVGIVLVVGVLAGVLAGPRPARRAARPNLLQAIAAEAGERRRDRYWDPAGRLAGAGSPAPSASGLRRSARTAPAGGGLVASLWRSRRR